MIPGFILMIETESTDPNMHKKNKPYSRKIVLSYYQQGQTLRFHFINTQIKQKHLCHQDEAKRFYLINRNLRSVMAHPDFLDTLLTLL